jgi:hypothetical protein
LALAKIAQKGEDLEKSIQAFFGEAFFNLLDILAQCQGQMPNSQGDKVEIRLEIIGCTSAIKPSTRTVLRTAERPEPVQAA